MPVFVNESEQVKIKPLGDGNTDFGLVELTRDSVGTRMTPHCKKHGAMLKVSPYIWRCVRSVSLETGKVTNDCRAGCEDIGWEKNGNTQ